MSETETTEPVATNPASTPSATTPGSTVDTTPESTPALPPVASTPPSPAPSEGMDEEKLGRAVAKGLTDAMRATQAGGPPVDRPLAKYTTDQLLAAKFEVNADGTALAPAQLLTIERELEAKRREDLYAASQITAQRVTGRTAVERDYPEFADPASPLFLKAQELIGGDPATLTAKELAIVVKAAAQDVGLQPLSKRQTVNPVVQARQETVEQIQAATAAANLPRGTGGSAMAAPLKSPSEMTYQEIEDELSRRRGY